MQKHVDPTHRPEGEKAGWHRLSTHIVFEDGFQKLRQDTVRVEGQAEPITFTYQEKPGGVLIVPVTPGGEVLLLRQYRYAVDDWCLEVPAGGTQDTGDMPLEVVAEKELREEIGGEAQALEYIGWFYVSGSLSDEVNHVFLATGVTRPEPPEREGTETVAGVQAAPIAEALAMIRDGRISLGPSALALLRCEERLRQMGN